jgi:hypothetical protein
LNVGSGKTLAVAGTLTVTGSATVEFADGSAASPSITNDGDTNTGIFFPAADTIAFAEGGVESMRIDASGNLGIGTTSPAAKLQTQQTSAGSRVTGALLQNVGSSASTAVSLDFAPHESSASPTTLARIDAIRTQTSNALTDLVFSTFNATLQERARIDSSGNLGVGTTSPAAKLHISVASAAVDGTKGVRITNPAGTVAVFECGNGGDSFIGTTSGSDFNIRTGNTVRATFDNAGNLLVGTTSGTTHNLRKTTNIPAVIIENGITSGFTDSVVNVSLGYAANTTNSQFIQCYDTSATRFKVLTNGNVQNTNNSYGSISDAKLKENITDATPKLAKLNQVRIVNYNLIGDETKQLGVIAQELEQVFPSMVEESIDRDEEGNDLGTITKSVKYSVFVPMLIKAIQELNAKFEEYKVAHP